MKFYVLTLGAGKLLDWYGRTVRASLMHTKLRLDAREIFALMRTHEPCVRTFQVIPPHCITHYSLLSTHYSLLLPSSSLPKSMSKFAIRHDGIDALSVGGEGGGGEVEEAVEEVGALCLREVLPVGDGGAL